MSRRHYRLTAFQSLFEFLLDRPLTVISFVALLTFFFVWHIPKLSIRTSVYDLLIEDLPETANYNAFKAVFGSDEIIRIVIKTDNVFDPATFGKIDALSASASGIEGVKRVISLPEIKKAVDTPAKKWNLAEFAAMLAPVKLFEGNLISHDRKVAALTLVLDREADRDSVIQAVDRIISDLSQGFTAYQIGMPLISQALARYTAKDFLRLPPITLILIALVLFVLYRKISYLVLPFVCLVVVLAWTFGFMALIGIPLSMLTMVVPVFLIAVGTAYCLHIVSAYSMSAQQADSQRRAVLATYAKIGLPSVLAILTTIVGLASLWFNRITAIHEFALFACFGLLSFFVVLFTLLPSLLVLLNPPKRSRSRLTRLDLVFDRILEKIVFLNLFRQKIVLSFVGGWVIFCLIGLVFIQVETNPVEYLKKDIPVIRHFHDIYGHLSGSFPINVVMKKNEPYAFENPETMADIARLQEYLETLPKVDKTVSFADYLKLVNYTLNQYDPKYYRLPEEAFAVRMAINNFKVMLGEDLYASFMNPDLSKTNILLLTHLSSSRDFLASNENIMTHVQKHFPGDWHFDVTGFGMAVSASGHQLTAGQLKSISVGLILIFGIMFLMFLSARVGLIAILPNCFPIIVNFGLMGWLGIKLSIATSLIASIAIGLAVDDTIHYLHRYNREFKKDLDKDRALRDTIMSVGRPIVFTTITISIGFFILVFSSFKPTAVFGLLMVLTMLAAIVGDLIILPSLMLHVELITAWDLLKLMPTLSGVPTGIAHELNQPLNAIRMGSEFLKMMLSRQAKISEAHLRQVVDEIIAQVDRASEIINRLRSFGKKQDAATEAVDLNESIKDVMSIMASQLSVENIEAQLDLDPALPPILAHKNRIAQLIYNFVINAFEAIDELKKSGRHDGGNDRIHIRTSGTGKQVVIEIGDSGIGISTKHGPRIFEPFYTTKTPGHGKGLGLTISNEIVRGYGGKIEAESKGKRGTVFKITLACALPENLAGNIQVSGKSLKQQ
jgi:predicted RND superfamily exporter protein